jgi:hypothetical protein
MPQLARHAAEEYLEGLAIKSVNQIYDARQYVMEPLAFVNAVEFRPSQPRRFSGVQKFVKQRNFQNFASQIKSTS